MSAICPRCAEPLVDAKRACIFCTGKLVAQILELNGVETTSSLMRRVAAIDGLRELGYSDRQVLELRAKVLDGSSVERVLEGLVEHERVGVGA